MAKSSKKKNSKKGANTNAPAGEHRKRVATNRQARFRYEILEKFQAGIVLVGSEVKSMREGSCTLSDSYAAAVGSEIFLRNCHISPYDPASQFNHDPTRPRKLLMHRREINRLIGKMAERGLTLVPLEVYFYNGKVKVDLGLGRGKSLYDKRETIKRRDQERDAAREMSGRE